MWRFTLLIGFLTVAGCGGPPDLPTLPVRGKVTLDGAPLSDAEVRYVPVDAEQGRVARGTLDRGGKFRLTTLREGDGALPGEYKVLILAYVPGSGGENSEAATRMREATGTVRDPSGKVFQPQPRIPARYLDPQRTPLTDSVDGDHSGYVEFHLEGT